MKDLQNPRLMWLKGILFLVMSGEQTVNNFPLHFGMVGAINDMRGEQFLSKYRR